LFSRDELNDMNKANEIYVNDVHSKLNRTNVCEIVKPESAEDIQIAVKKTECAGKSISVAGGFHAMGGQQFTTGGVLFDLSKMNRVIKFEPKEKLIEVEAGIKWDELLGYTVPAQTGAKNQVGIRQKQTGADRLSIGGAGSANIHGRGLQMKPFINDVESFRIVTANGEISNCSRRDNSELFRLAVSGYGLFGIIASVTLRLTERRKVRSFVTIESVENLESLLATELTVIFFTEIFNLPLLPNQKIFSEPEFFRVIFPFQTKRLSNLVENFQSKNGKICCFWRTLTNKKPLNFTPRII
jgi:FAD/FMN-containing dehydrogenase